MLRPSAVEGGKALHKLIALALSSSKIQSLEQENVFPAHDPGQTEKERGVRSQQALVSLKPLHSFFLQKIFTEHL